MSFAGVSDTALLVAAMRAEEKELFIDPYAEILAGEKGKTLLKKAIEVSGPQPVIALRTAFIDGKIKEFLNIGGRQIVIIASGMDSRAYRLDFPTGTTIYELDHAEVQTYKAEKLRNVEPRCKRVALSIDLAHDWTKPLLDSGMNPKEKTLWLVEGLVMYLDPAAVQILFGRVKTLAKTGDVLLGDTLSRTLLDAPFMQDQLEFLKSMGAPWKFGENEPEKFFQKLGWKAEAKQAGELFPTRWPFPVAPRHVPDVPRGFFIFALKI